MFGPNYKTTGWFEHRLNIPLKLCRCLKLNLAFTSHKDLDLMVCYPSSRGLKGEAVEHDCVLEDDIKVFIGGTPSHHPFFQRDFPFTNPLEVPPMAMETSI